MVFGFLKPRKASPAPRQPVLERVHLVANRELPLKIVENDRAKRMTLRIDAGGRGLRVTIPPGLRQGEVDLFLDRHRNWLETKFAKLPDRPKVRPGVKMPLRGVPHLIVHEPAKRGTVTEGNDAGRPALIVHGREEHLPRRLADFLKRAAKNDIEPLVAKHCARVGRQAKAVRFKDTSSRWGSCTSDGSLSFSWRIMMAPPTVIDYLVSHEVAHLKEMNHGPKFWALCKELCPRTEEARAWLKRNGSALQAIDFD
jgi:predicted metal-dependent hydrolase